jgi:hypothetical protein
VIENFVAFCIVSCNFLIKEVKMKERKNRVKELKKMTRGLVVRRKKGTVRHSFANARVLCEKLRSAGYRAGQRTVQRDRGPYKVVVRNARKRAQEIRRRRQLAEDAAFFYLE